MGNKKKKSRKTSAPTAFEPAASLIQEQATGSSIVPHQPTSAVASAQNLEAAILEHASPQPVLPPKLQQPTTSIPQQNETRTLWCLILGDSTPFEVSCHTSTDIDDLKRLIYEERRGTLHNIGAADLVLWKLHEPISLRPPQMLADRVRSHDKDISAFAVQLEPVDTVSEVFPGQLAKSALHIIVQRSTDVPASQKRAGSSIVHDDGHNIKRMRISHTSPLPTDDVLIELDTKSKETHSDPGWYSTASNKDNLPFPLVYPDRLPSDRFHYSSSNPLFFVYMGRQRFLDLWNSVLSMNLGAEPSQVYIHGTMGYGKSHILAALACLLRRCGERVVYMPDCRQMLDNVVLYMKCALLCAFSDPDSSTERDQIRGLTSEEDILHFCQSLKNISLYFIVDQMNALEAGYPERDSISNDKKWTLSAFLRRLFLGHYSITSASTNYRTTVYMAKQQTGEIKLQMLGGMSPEETREWWNHHLNHFEQFSDADKHQIEDLTGCIPLLLDAFIGTNATSLDDLEPQIWEQDTLASVTENTMDFAVQQREKLEPRTFRERYVRQMLAYITNGYILGSGVEIDNRYFYLDHSYGRYTCGLARQAIIRFLREYGEEHDFLGPEWLMALKAFKNNPSVIGFTVEQIIISNIASAGVKTGDFSIPGARITPFAGGVAQLQPQMDQRSTYYIPLDFNLKTIDGLFVDIDPTAKTAHLVPIQITVAKRHKDSEGAFFENWDRWIKGLEDFTIETSFVWIHEGKRGRREVEAKLTELRGRTIQNWPHHTVHWISIEQIDKSLARILAKVRP